MSSMKWLPLESNPDVMNKCLKNFGVPENFGVSDIYSLDDVSVAFIPQPVLGVLLLFPISEQYEVYCDSVEAHMENQEACPGIYFMKQTIHNACGTIALIHALGNNEQNLDLDPASVLKKFLESTRNLSPEERGKFLEQNMEISAVHDEVAQEGQTETPNLDDDVNLHFIALVRVGNKLVELDGRKSGPVLHGDTNGENFLKDACRVVKEYMDREPDNVNFNAMAFGSLH